MKSHLGRFREHAVSSPSSQLISCRVCMPHRHASGSPEIIINQFIRAYNFDLHHYSSRSAFRIRSVIALSKIPIHTTTERSTRLGSSIAIQPGTTTSSASTTSTTAFRTAEEAFKASKRAIKYIIIVLALLRIASELTKQPQLQFKRVSFLQQTHLRRSNASITLELCPTTTPSDRSKKATSICL